MTALPMVSIIMPAFNTARYIGDAIASVMAQSYDNWELLLVDDGSTDDTGEIAAMWAKRDRRGRIKVIHQANAGVANARNAALERMDRAAEFVAFLDSDDVWYADALSTMVEHLRGVPGAVGVHGLRTYLDREGRRIEVNGATEAPLRRRAASRGLRTLHPEEPTTFAVLAYGCCVFPGALLVRAEAMRGAGRFDQAVSPAEDWDMFLRLSLRAPFAFIRHPLYGYRLHGDNATASTARKNASLYWVRRKWAFDAAVPPSARATIMSGFRYYELYRAAVCVRQMIAQTRQGAVRNAAALAKCGLDHVLTCLTPGGARLAALGERSALVQPGSSS